MSLKILKEQIDKFLESPDPEVLAIRGPWGVGKTYTWNKLLIEAKDRIALKNYSYVSLFGVNDLNTFKLSIFQQMLSTKLIDQEPTYQTYLKNATDMTDVGIRKIGVFFRKIFATNELFKITDAIAMLLTKETIICIDDFERKGLGLTIKDILGMVSILKEQRKCKLVLIFNDGEFSDTDKEEYRKFREKVIDTELFFDLSANECAEILFGKDENDLKLRRFTIKLGIKNIRILKKIERLEKKLKDILHTDGYESEVLDQAISSLVLFCFCFYSRDPDIPPLEYLKRIGNSMLGLSEKDKSKNINEARWKALLREYEYVSTDAFDLEIAKAVETGYFNEVNLKKEAKKLNDRLINSKSEQSFGEAWRVYHDSFDDNEDEVIETLTNSFYKNYKNISPTNLDGIVRLFRNLGRANLADELINFYIVNRGNERVLFDPIDNPFYSDLKDEKLLAAFQLINSEKPKNRKALKEILESIAKNHSWSREDESTLAEASAEDYYKLFKEEKGRHLHSLINAGLQFGRFANPTKNYLNIANNAKEALIKIGKGNRINASRVSKYGIEVNEKLLEEN